MAIRRISAASIFIAISFVYQQVDIQERIVTCLSRYCKAVHADLGGKKLVSEPQLFIQGNEWTSKLNMTSIPPAPPLRQIRMPSVVRSSAWSPVQSPYGRM